MCDTVAFFVAMQMVTKCIHPSSAVAGIRQRSKCYLFPWFVCVQKREAGALTVVFLSRSRSGMPAPIVSWNSGSWNSGREQVSALSGLEWVMNACIANVRRTSAPTRTTQSCVVRLLSITLMLVSSTFLLSCNNSLARHSQFFSQVPGESCSVLSSHSIVFLKSLVKKNKEKRIVKPRLTAGWFSVMGEKVL